MLLKGGTQRNGGREGNGTFAAFTYLERTGLCKVWKTVEIGLEEQCATLPQHMAVKKFKLIKGKPHG